MKLSIIKKTEYVVLSGTIKALKEAFRLRKEGKQVLLVTQDTYLAEEICAYGACKAADKMRENLPKNVFLEEKMTSAERKQEEMLHPAALKRYLEEECEKAGIGLLYFAFPIDIIEAENEKILRVAAKGGIFGICCKQVKDYRKPFGQHVLHAMAVKGTGQQYELLTARRAGAGDGETAKALLELRHLLLEDFAEKRRQNLELRLGRFAPRSYDPEMEKNNKTDGSGEWKPAGQKDGQPFSSIMPKGSILSAENDFTRFGRFEQIEADKEIEGRAEQFDLIVAGGGTAGAMAALHGARKGLCVVLVEPCFDLGGTSTLGGVNSCWFGCRFSDVREIELEAEKIYEEYGIERSKGIWSRHDEFHAGIQGMVLLKLCLAAGVSVRFGELSYAAIKKDKQVIGIAAVSDTGSRFYLGKTVIDATGDGDIAVMAGADSLYGSQKDCITYWSSLAQYQSGDRYKNNFSSMVICADPLDYTRFILLGRKRGEKAFDHGTYVSMRESRHIRGLEEVNLKDIVTFRTWEDGLYTCFSNYDPKGKLDADMVYSGVLPPQIRMQIPLSALIPTDKTGQAIGGIYVAGKAASVTHNAFPGVRMQPDLMHQGAVLGALEAYAQQKGCRMEDLEEGERRRFLSLFSDDPLTLPEWNPDIEKALANISGESRTHWVDAPFTFEETRQNECLTLICGDTRELKPLLLERMKAEKDEEVRRLLTGIALFHGMDDWTEEYCQGICKEFFDTWEQSGTLPVRKASVMCAQLLPDHGVMPETAYRLNVCGWSQKECILEPFLELFAILKKIKRDYRDIKKGIYHYVEAFAYAAERSGQKEFIPLLRQLRDFPEFNHLLDEKAQADLMTERLLILLFSLNRALARLGDKSGYLGLIGLLKAPGMPICCSACMTLRQLTGVSIGLNPDEWKRALQSKIKFPVQKVCLRRF